LRIVVNLNDLQYAIMQKMKNNAMKSEIITILKQHDSAFVSGQEISKRFGITRAAVWKYIKQIQKEGYELESAPRNGYKLVSCPDILTYDEISPYLKTRYIGQRIIHYGSTDSTSNKARELAESGEPEGTVVISETQTEGKGRSGKTWDSEAYKGIWMSIILRPDVDMSSVAMVTQIGCAAVGTVMDTLIGGIQIKWPNDVLVNGKKFCGILTESSGEADKTDYVVLGIGINVNQTENDFPAPLDKTATSIKIETGKDISRQRLVSDILYAFEKLYKNVQNQENIDGILDFFTNHSNIIGKNILLKRNHRKSAVYVTGLNRQGQLVIRYKDGSYGNISSGDISILE